MTTTPALRRATAAALIIVPLAFSLCFALLQQLFDYPAVLRQPTADVLASFATGGSTLIGVWYVLSLTALAFVPLSVLVHHMLAERTAPLALWLATTFGVLAGVVQTLGFVRWPFLVPHLAQAYLDPAASEAQRTTAVLVFEAFHRYAGMAVGEHLGYVSTSLWTLLIAVVLLRRVGFPRWLGASGVVLALGIASGLAEPAGWELGGTIKTLSYLVWALWLIALGVTVLLRRSQPTPAESARQPLTPASASPIA